MTTPHIIEHEGREYDLYKLEMPIGLLRAIAKPVYDALKAWPHGIEIWSYGSRLWVEVVDPDWHRVYIYRAKPVPKEPMIETRSGECYVDMYHADRRPSFWTMPGILHTKGNWTATLEDGKLVRIIWEAD